MGCIGGKYSLISKDNRDDLKSRENMNGERSSHQHRHDHGDGDQRGGQKATTRGESSIPPAEQDRETVGDVEGDARERKNIADFERDYNLILDKNKELDNKLKDKDEQIKELYARCENLKLQSDKITMQMAKQTSKSKSLENTNDPFSNMKLAQGFDKLKKDWWLDISDTLSEGKYKKDELAKLKILANLIKEVNRLCKKEADDYFRTALYLDSDEALELKEDDTFSQEDFEVLRTFRRIHGQKETVIKRVCETVSKKLESQMSQILLEDEEESETLKKKVKQFVESLSKSCWLMAISSPTVTLHFDVVGKNYEDIRDRFMKYTTQQPVATTAEVGNGCVLLVAWPCLQLENEAFLAKGEVVVADVK